MATAQSIPEHLIPTASATADSITGDVSTPAADIVSAVLRVEPRSRDIISEVLRVLEMSLEGGDTRVEATALSLGVSSRTLQRCLGADRTTYRAVLAHARRHRRAQLRSMGLGEGAIAQRLGFYDVRAMRRSLDGGH